MKRSKIDWSGPIQAAVVAAIILGANIPLFLYTQNSMQSNIKAIEAEMKDFHAKLIAIEERRKR